MYRPASANGQPANLAILSPDNSAQSQSFNFLPPSGVAFGSNQPGDFSHEFNAHLTLITGEQVQADGSKHAGIIPAQQDVGGTPTASWYDFTGPLQQDSFSGGTSAEFAQFAHNRFYFELRPVGGGESKIYSVDMATFDPRSAKASDYKLEETVGAEDARYGFLVNSDGSIQYQRPSSPTILKEGAKFSVNSSGLIGKDRYLWLDKSNNALWSIPLFESLKNVPIFNLTKAAGAERLTPSTSRKISSATVSADGKQIAFLAQQGTVETFYKMSSSGGDPVPVQDPLDIKTPFTVDFVIGWPQ